MTSSWSASAHFRAYSFAQAQTALQWAITLGLHPAFFKNPMQCSRVSGMAQYFFHGVNALPERFYEHVVIEMGKRLLAVRALEVATHGLRKSKYVVAVVADVEIVFLLELRTVFKFVQHHFHIIADGIVNVIDPQCQRYVSQPVSLFLIL